MFKKYLRDRFDLLNNVLEDEHLFEVEVAACGSGWGKLLKFQPTNQIFIVPGGHMQRDNANRSATTNMTCRNTLKVSIWPKRDTCTLAGTRLQSVHVAYDKPPYPLNCV